MSAGRRRCARARSPCKAPPSCAGPSPRGSRDRGHDRAIRAELDFAQEADNAERFTFFARAALESIAFQSAELLEAMESGIPLGRAGTPQDAANAVYLFCIPESDYITGEDFVASLKGYAEQAPEGEGLVGGDVEIGRRGVLGRGELEDSYAIAELLLGDPEDLIHKAVGGVLRFAGDKDPPRLLAFLDTRAATLPRVIC